MTKIITVNSNSKDGLRAKCIGYNHDHARALYFGSMKDMPFKYMKYFEETSRYCAVIEEDVPIKR